MASATKKNADWERDATAAMIKAMAPSDGVYRLHKKFKAYTDLHHPGLDVNLVWMAACLAARTVLESSPAFTNDLILGLITNCKGEVPYLHFVCQRLSEPELTTMESWFSGDKFKTEHFCIMTQLNALKAQYARKFPARPWEVAGQAAIDALPSTATRDDLCTSYIKACGSASTWFVRVAAMLATEARMTHDSPEHLISIPLKIIEKLCDDTIDPDTLATLLPFTVERLEERTLYLLYCYIYNQGSRVVAAIMFKEITRRNHDRVPLKRFTQTREGPFRWPHGGVAAELSKVKVDPDA